MWGSVASLFGACHLILDLRRFFVATMGRNGTWVDDLPVFNFITRHVDFAIIHAAKMDCIGHFMQIIIQ